MTDLIALDIDTQIKVATLKTTQLDAQIRYANLMADASIMIPDHLRGKPADCLAICIQAESWGMDAFQVAQKTHLINGVLGYESQLVNAVITSSTATKGSFKYEYSDGWEKIVGKVGMKKNHNQKMVASKLWSDEDEKTLWCRVGCTLAGENVITWGEPVYLGNIMTRNSPLWVTAPKQQLAYLAVKYWSRLYTPAVLLGVHDKQEIEQEPIRTEREINPVVNDADNLNAMFSDTKKEPAREPINEPEIMPVDDGAPSPFEQIKGHIASATDKQGYAEVSQMYNNALNNKHCTNEELNNLMVMLKALHAKLMAG
jgi:hypothetical protein